MARLEEHFLAAGWLQKQRDGVFREGWSRRFVVLTPSRLYYFREASGAEDDLLSDVRGSLPLEDVLRAQVRAVTKSGRAVEMPPVAAEEEDDDDIVGGGAPSRLSSSDGLQADIFYYVEISVPQGKLKKESGFFSGGKDHKGNAQIVFRTAARSVASDWVQMISEAATEAQKRAQLRGPARRKIPRRGSAKI